MAWPLVCTFVQASWLMAVGAAGAAGAALQQQWSGTITFDDRRLNTTDAPLNVTVADSVASFSWFFTAEACRHQFEPSLVWSTAPSTGGSHGTVIAQGCVAQAQRNCSGATNFYSFEGSLSSGGDSINGTVSWLGTAHCSMAQPQQSEQICALFMPAHTAGIPSPVRRQDSVRRLQYQKGQ